MTQIYGTILNYETNPIINVSVELFNKSNSISDIVNGKNIQPLKKTISNTKGNYEIDVDDGFEGYIFVPTQSGYVNNQKVKVNLNYAVITGTHHNVVVKTNIVDEYDLNMDGIVDLDEAKKWISSLETRIKNLEEDADQTSKKFHMIVNVLLPLILKK